MSSIFLVGLAGKLGAQPADSAQVQVHLVDVVLRKVSNPQPRVSGHSSLKRRVFTHQNFQQRRFTTPVGSDKRNSGVQLNVQVDIG
ncbi:hypothetical protein OGATHE_000067 [Ogataea polymorpha]|uniref:Uncharacterized protein n=1 Tax=Ogataea polymorpha TaxID=460523 RepID=A0A9P8TGK1_9ASCO|nr:hypothetical protein OGATHE_000067 [Ogataea polymorpha]